MNRVLVWKWIQFFGEYYIPVPNLYEVNKDFSMYFVSV